MKVLLACEESQAVCKEFRKLGHEAYSCDIQECSGGHPEWHIQQDVLTLLNGDCISVGAATFITVVAKMRVLREKEWFLIPLGRRMAAYQLWLNKK